MATTRKMIQEWFDQGVKDGYTWMVIVTDTFDYDDYPVYARHRRDAEATVADPGKMQSVMEVYDLTAERGPQLSAQRVWALNANDPSVKRKLPDQPVVSASGAWQGHQRATMRTARVKPADALGNPAPTGPDIVELSLSQRLTAAETALAILRGATHPFSRLSEAEKRIAKLEKKLKKLAD